MPELVIERAERLGSSGVERVEEFSFDVQRFKIEEGVTKDFS